MILTRKNSKCKELDIIKVFAIILVVVGHVCMFYTSHALCTPLNSSIFLSHAKEVIYSFHMPLFIFVSGCVYGYQTEILNKQQEFLPFIKKKWKRLMTPYFIFGLFYVAPFMVLLGYRENYWNYAFNGIILSEDCRHLWYVWALFNIFILCYFFLKIIKKLKLNIIILTIIAVGCLLLSKYIPNIFQLSTAFKYIIWFTLGYVFFAFKESLNRAYLIKYGYLGGLFLIFKFICPDTSFPFDDSIYALSGIVFCWSLANSLKNIEKNQFFKLVDRNSYGLYLFHPIIIYVLFYLLGHLDVSPYLLSISVFIISFVLSIVFTEIVRMCRLNFIIGEK